MAVNIEGSLSKPRRRNIMRAFKISEISAVDRPAQEGAKAVLLKRDTTTKGDTEMTEKELLKQIADLTEALAKTKTDGEAVAKKVAELTTANADLVAKAALASEETEFLKAKEKMSAEQQAFLDRIKGKDKDEEKKTKKAFIDMTPEARDKLIVEKRADDEVITIEGQEVRKSVVGATQFSIMKSQSDRVTALEKSQAVAVEKAETVELTKRAEDEFGHLPGTAEEKVGVLRVIGKADKKVQEVFATMMKAGEKAIISAFDKVGHRGGNQAIDKGAFEKRVAEIRSRDKSSRQVAMETARKEYPAEFAAYQGQN